MELILHLLYTKDLLTVSDTIIATYADIDIFAVYIDQLGDTRALDQINKWATKWSFKFSDQKSVPIIFMNCNIHLHYRVYIGNLMVPQWCIY